MALCADRFFVDIPFRYQGSDSRHYAIVATFARIAVYKTNIGVEDDKAVAQVERVVDRGTMWTGHMVAVERIGITLVEIDDYRIFGRSSR